MAFELARSFVPNLVEQTAFCLQSKTAREAAGRRAAARKQFLEIQQAHAVLLSSIGLIRSELAALAVQGGAGAPTMQGLSRVLEVFRARRGGNISWLDLYGATSAAIESINFGSTRSLDRLCDDQFAAVLKFARAAGEFVETTYNRDFDAVGMAVTCDRLVEQGVRSDADAFRVETLLQRFEAAERDLADSGARWSATFEAMASWREFGLNDDWPLPPRKAPADWFGTLSRRSRRAESNAPLSIVLDMGVD